MNIAFCESPSIDVSPFSLHPVPCPAQFPYTISPLPAYPQKQEFENQPKKILLVMAACYLADPLGSGLLSLKFLVLEAAELSALGRASFSYKSLEP